MSGTFQILTFLTLFVSLQNVCIAVDSLPEVTQDQAIQEVLELQNAPRAPNFVDRELFCLQEKATAGLHSSDVALQMYKLLTPELMRLFRQMKMGKKERALFYAQMMEETGGLTNLSETNQFGSTQRAAGDPNNNTASVVTNQSNKTTTCPAKFGIFCGRGLIQITRCDNYVSTLHYINLEEKRQEEVYNQIQNHRPPGSTNPYWKPYWNYTNGSQVSENCTPNQIEDLKVSYKKETGMELDPYNLLTPEGIENFAVPGKVLKGSNGKLMFTTRLQSLAALAYWRGNCGAHVEAMTSDRRRNFPKCQKLINPSETNGNGHMNRCLTQCVHGDTSGWEKRNKWYELLMENKEPKCMSDEI